MNLNYITHFIKNIFSPNSPTQSSQKGLVGEVDVVSDNPTRFFTQRYSLALIATAVLFYLSYSLMISTLNKQALFVSQANILARQNTFSQEISKKILVIQDCGKENKCRQEMKSLENTLKEFELTQRNLLLGDGKLRKRGLKNKWIDSLHTQNNFFFYPIVDASRQLIRLKDAELLSKRNQLPNPTAKNKIIINIQKILYKEQVYSRLVAQLGLLYNQEAQNYIERNRFFQRLVLLIGLFVLLLEAIFLFPPILQKLKQYLLNLQSAHQDSQQAHQELSKAYQQLKEVEEETRLNAETIRQTNETLLMAQKELQTAHDELAEKNKRLEETYNVMNLNKQLESSRFFDAALSQFSDVMRWKSNQNIYSWTENLLSELVPYFKGLQAVIYAYDYDKDKLFVAGSYAVEQEILLNKSEIALGEGLVGQVAKSIKPIYLQDLNGQAKNFISHSGTQEVHPQTLIVIPLVYNDQIAGVLEMSSAVQVEERYIELLKRMSVFIGSHLNALQDQKRINQLFADSQMAQRRLRKSLLKIQENEERFRKLSEVTQEGLLFLNGNLIADANSVLLKMTGYEEKDLLEAHYINLIAPKYRFEIEDKKILKDGRLHETVALRKNGEIFPIEIQSRNVKYNNEEITVISIRDITQRKKTEKELEEANRIARLVTELEKKNKDITASIEYAQRIQEAILPSGKIFGKGFLENFVLYMPKDIVSGDFYWFAEKGEYALFAAVDCTGHGVPGAFMSIIGYSNLNKIVLEQANTDPEVILSKLDKEVTEVLKQHEGDSQSRDGMDVALCSLNIFEKTLHFAGAYRPMYLVRGNELLEYKGNPYPIGGNFKFKKKKEFTQHTINLLEGDTLYIFSDGFADQFGSVENRKYLTKQFKELLVRIQPYKLEEQKEIISQEFYDWKGSHKQMDDVLVIGLRF